MLESRRDRRVSLDILLNKYIDGLPHVCRAVNISRGGMLLYRVFEPQIPHQEVSVEFQLPGSERVLRADGQVLQEHLTSKSFGVRFTRMDQEDRLFIDRYLRGLPIEDEHSSMSES